MPDIIKLLSDNIANQIAAGEVVQRPASLLKELLENSIDAGAENIKIIIKDSGRTLVQVIDDGKGMSETDARMCFERHATSKISTIDDISKIITLGFRGEALASIASVSQVELKTKTESQNIGTYVVIEGSEFKKQENISMLKGTDIAVHNLFYNTPARRNFLKNDNVEMKHIIDVFQQISIPNYKVGFSMYHNDKTVYELLPSNLKTRISAIFGNKYYDTLLPVEEKTIVVNISGYINKADSLKKSGTDEYFFLNNRYIKCGLFRHSILEAYKKITLSDLKPSFFIFLEINPEEVDVNVHPTKTEVKFRNEREIYAILSSTIKGVFSKFQIVPGINFEEEQAFKMKQLPNDYIPKEPHIKVNKTYNPFYEQKTYENHKIYPSKIEAHIENLEQINRPQIENIITADDDFDISSLKYFLLYEYWLICELNNGVLWVNLKLAHSYYIFKILKEQYDNNNDKAQKLIIPIEMELSMGRTLTLLSNLTELEKIGFKIISKENKILINQIPNFIDKINNLEEFLNSFVEELNLDKKNRNLNNIDSLLEVISKDQKIKYLYRNNIPEKNIILNDILNKKILPKFFSGKILYGFFEKGNLEKIFY